MLSRSIIAGAAAGLILAIGAATLAEAPEVSADLRVGEIRHAAGEPKRILAHWTGDKILYRVGDVLTDEVLPDAYPRPTAPGVVELKRYPSVRRAEFVGSGDEPGRTMGRRSTGAFWPLFQHIQRRDIPMTAPVEMDYPDMVEGDANEPGGWSMSFLYRTPDLGPTGQDGGVRVYDTAPVTVLSLGVRGDLSLARLTRAVNQLEGWVIENDGWRVAGDVRTMGYNGPNIPSSRRWWEVQLIVEPTAPAETATADTAR